MDEARVACRLRVIGERVHVICDIRSIVPPFVKKLRERRNTAHIDATAVALVNVFSEITHSSTRMRAAFLQWVVRSRHEAQNAEGVRHDAQNAEDARTLIDAEVQVDVARAVSVVEDDMMQKRLCVLDNMATIHAELVAIARSYRLDNCIMRRRVGQMQRATEDMHLQVEVLEDKATHAAHELEAIRLENSSLRRRLCEIRDLASDTYYV